MVSDGCENYPQAKLNGAPIVHLRQHDAPSALDVIDVCGADVHRIDDVVPFESLTSITSVTGF